MKQDNTLNKWTREFISWSFIILVIYFWTVSLAILFGLVIIFGILFYGIYKLFNHILNFQNFELARKNKPKWFIFGNKLYNKIVDYIEQKVKEKSKISKNEIISAMEFYDFYEIEEVTKYEIKYRWKEVQKICHPDSGIRPNVEKSQLANKYKDILLEAVKQRND